MTLILQIAIYISIIGDQPLPFPRCVTDHVLFRHNLALVAESMELAGRHQTLSLSDVRSIYLSLGNNRCRLRDIDNFFFLRVEDTNLHIVAIKTKIMPFINVCMNNAALTYGAERDMWLHVKSQAEVIYRIYDYIDDLHRDIPPDAKRRRLQYMREVLGEENYAKGNIPPPLPLWLFQR
jgi:hypothetical protein